MNLLHSADDLRYVGQFPDVQSSRFCSEVYFSELCYTDNVLAKGTSKKVEFVEHQAPLSMKTVFKGSEHYQSGYQHYLLEKNQVLIFDNGRKYSHWINSAEEVETFTVFFHPAFVTRLLATYVVSPEKNLDQHYPEQMEVYFFERLYPALPGLSTLLYHLAQLCECFEANKGLIDEAFINLFAELLVLQKQSLVEANRLKPVKFTTKIEIYRRLSYVRDYLESSYKEPITLHDCSRIALMSPEYLLRQFKSLYGITPHQYLINRRIDAAAKLLTRESLPVAEVCRLVGYDDIASFSKLFKKKISTNPSIYAKIIHNS